MRNKVYGDKDIIYPVVRLDKNQSIIEHNARRIGVFIGKDDVLGNLFNVMRADRIVPTDREDFIATDIIDSMQQDDGCWDELYKSMDYHTFNSIMTHFVFDKLDDYGISTSWAMDEAISDYVKSNDMQYDAMNAIIKSAESLREEVEMPFEKAMVYYKDIFDKNNEWFNYVDKVNVPEANYTLEFSIKDNIRRFFNDYKYRADVIEYILENQHVLLNTNPNGDVNIGINAYELQKMLDKKFGDPDAN